MPAATLFDAQGRSLLSVPLSPTSPSNPEKVGAAMAVVVVDQNGTPVNWANIGGSGGSGTGGTSPSSFIFEQIVPSTIWVITHNLKRYPYVVVVDADGNEGIPDVDYHLDDPQRASFTLTVQLSQPLSGKAILS